MVSRDSGQATFLQSERLGCLLACSRQSCEGLRPPHPMPCPGWTQLSSSRFTRLTRPGHAWPMSLRPRPAPHRRITSPSLAPHHPTSPHLTPPVGWARLWSVGCGWARSGLGWARPEAEGSRYRARPVARASVTSKPSAMQVSNGDVCWHAHNNPKTRYIYIYIYIYICV